MGTGKKIKFANTTFNYPSNQDEFETLVEKVAKLGFKKCSEMLRIEIKLI